jgi:hypothetical protein
MFLWPWSLGGIRITQKLSHGLKALPRMKPLRFAE